MRNDITRNVWDDVKVSLLSVRQPSLESLRILEACVRHGNFTRAATELGLSPAAVSLRIRNLENNLGVALFERRGPLLRITGTGAALGAAMAENLTAVWRAVDACRANVDEIVVSAPPSFAALWLAPRLRRRAASAIRVRLDISMELREPGDVDLAVRSGSGSWRGFESQPLLSAWATPMLSPQLAESAVLREPADLALLPLLPNPDWNAWFREATGNVPRLCFQPFEFPTYELDASAALAGAGVALLVAEFVEDHLRSGRLLRPFPERIIPARHHLLLRTDESRHQVREFAAWLAAEASDQTMYQQAQAIPPHRHAL